MRNAMYGKTLKDVGNRIDIRLLSNKKTSLKWSSKQRYLSQNLFDSRDT